MKLMLHDQNPDAAHVRLQTELDITCMSAYHAAEVGSQPPGCGAAWPLHLPLLHTSVEQQPV